MKTSIPFKQMSDPVNQGKHLIFVGRKVFRARTGPQTLRLLKQLRKKYAHQKIALTYVPKADALILFHAYCLSL
ncbi:MAG: hypothetical protein A3G87_07745 [Omnitrophica bacterium RIFCSPLOWO2_12_FULL_50_11]|nr:MAG: hypothetical protein A3G87_07745 [Omnitrophica bacterium RIFCSPLOWO2_12_FULL_50_11]